MTLNYETINNYNNDIIDFLSWLLNTLKIFFSKRQYENIIEEYFPRCGPSRNIYIFKRRRRK